jgi:copper chaperone CopZ
MSTVTTTFKVTGMTCGHCEGAVREEVSALEGVTAVEASAATGLVTVTSAAEPDEAAVRAAVDEAGYELIGRA